MSAYFSKMKDIADNLTMAGYHVSDDDFIMHLLQRLPLEYDAVVANINSFSGPLAIEDVQSLLLSQEIRLQQATIEVTPAAHVVEKFKRKEGHKSNWLENNSQDRGRSNMRGRGRGRGGAGGCGSRIICQLCEIPGHTVHDCWYRFDTNFQGSTN